MSLFPWRSDGSIDWEPFEDSHQVIDLVECSAYTFVFARSDTCRVNLKDNGVCD
jgi:hypothetical protein